MGAILSHEAGFYGKASLDGVTLLATGGNANLNHDPIFSSGVWGAGWYNAATQVAYALNVLTVDGSCDFELTPGVVAKLATFGFSARTTPMNIILLPNGMGGYTGNAYCSGVTLSASTDSAVTGNFTFMGDDAAGFTPTAQGGSNLGTGTAPSILYPFWNTAVTLDNVESTKIIDWNTSYTSTFQFLTVCKTHTPIPPVAPDYIVVGPMEASGSFTLFGLTSELSPASYHSIHSMSISMKDTLNTNGGLVTYAKMLYNSSGVNVTTGGDYIQISMDFTAVGDGTKPPMLLAAV